MKRVLMGLIALVAGFFAGLILSEVIGVFGVLVLHQAVGFRFLPVVAAVIAAALTVALFGRKAST